MKNAFVALALVLVCTTAFASKANTNARLQKIASSPFGKTILETIQVELKSKDDPRPRILELLSELEQQTISDQAAADADFQASGDRHSQVVDDLSGQADDAQSALNDNTANQADWSAELNQDNDELDSAQELLADLQDQLDAADAQRETNQATWEAGDEKYATIIDVLTQVRGVLTQRLSGRYESEFLQNAHNEIMGSFSQIKETVQSKAFKKLSPGFSKLVSFITMKVEASLKAPSAEDEDAENGLTSIVTVIDNLVAGVQEERDSALDFNNNDIAVWQQTHDRLTADISTTTSNVDNLENEIADLNGRLTAVAADIAAETDRLAELNQQLIDESAAWEDYGRKYASETHDRNQQLEILQEVEDIVQHQLSGLRDYAENYIGSH